MTNFVQKYISTDLNAPPLQGQKNSLIRGPLNACLVDGYSDDAIAISSLTGSGTTATATCSADDILRLQSGSILTISAATGAGGDAALYNITAFITVTSGTTFTYPLLGSPSGDATGSPVWSKLLVVSTLTRGGTGNLTALATLLNSNGTLVTGNYMTIAGCTSTGASVFNVTAKISVVSVWAALAIYASGALVTNSGNTYVCRTAGTAAGSGGPTGTGTAISDGSATWDYVQAGSGLNLFTYIMGSDPGANASGAPTYYKSGLGWTRPFTNGTNSQTYRSADATSNQLYLQVIDNGEEAGGDLEVMLYGAEDMSADRTITTGQFPTVAQRTSGLCFRKSSTVNTVNRVWMLIGDDRTFYMNDVGVSSYSTLASWALGFGHFIPFKAGDGFNTFLAGATLFNSGGAGGQYNSISIMQAIGILTTSSMYVPRLHSQLGSSVAVSMNGYAQSLTYPMPSDNGMYFAPTLVCDAANNLRGRMPGFYQSMHARSLNNMEMVDGINGMPGVILTQFDVCSSGVGLGCMFVDHAGPWT